MALDLTTCTHAGRVETGQHYAVDGDQHTRWTSYACDDCGAAWSTRATWEAPWPIQIPGQP